MAVPVEKGAAFTAGTPQPLFQARFAPINARSLYRPSPDGQRFLVSPRVRRGHAAGRRGAELGFRTREPSR